MKKGKKILLFILVIVVVAISVSAAWYFSPKTFLKGIEPSNVSSIVVKDGNNGNDFVIEDESEIQCIVENIQSIAMTREEVSVNSTGWAFGMKFYDNSGKEIDSFIINGADTIVDDPFFYRCNGDLCFDYLKELEDTYVK